jgi:hypothetical protein
MKHYSHTPISKIVRGEDQRNCKKGINKLTGSLFKE